MIRYLKTGALAWGIALTASTAAAQLGTGHSEARKDLIKIHQPFKVDTKMKLAIFKDGKMQLAARVPADLAMPFCILDNRSGKTLHFSKNQKIEGAPAKEGIMPPYYYVFENGDFGIACKFQVQNGGPGGVIATANVVLDKWILINGF